MAYCNIGVLFWALGTDIDGLAHALFIGVWELVMLLFVGIWSVWYK